MLSQLLYHSTYETYESDMTRVLRKHKLYRKSLPVSLLLMLDLIMFTIRVLVRDATINPHCHDLVTCQFSLAKRLPLVVVVVGIVAVVIIGVFSDVVVEAEVAGAIVDVCAEVSDVIPEVVVDVVVEVVARADVEEPLLTNTAPLMFDPPKSTPTNSVFSKLAQLNETSLNFDPFSRELLNVTPFRFA